MADADLSENSVVAAAESLGLVLGSVLVLAHAGGAAFEWILERWDKIEETAHRAEAGEGEPA